MLVHKNRFRQLQVGKFHAPHLGPYKITQVGPGSVLVRLSPTLGGEIGVAHSFLRRFPLKLEDDEEWFPLDAEKESEVEIAERDGEEAGEEDILDASEPEEPEAPMTRSRAKARSDPPSKISGPDVLPDLNAEEMAHKRYYVVHYVVRHEHRQSLKFLVKWKGFNLTEATWEPVRAFILGKDRVNGDLVNYCQKHDLQSPSRGAKRLAAQRQDESRHSLISRSPSPPSLGLLSLFTNTPLLSHFICRKCRATPP